MSTAENGVITSGARERTTVLSPMGVAEAAGVRGLLPARTGAIIIASGLTAAGVMEGWSISHCEYRNLTSEERDLASRVQKWAWANKRKGGCLIDREAVDHEAWAAILRITHSHPSLQSGFGVERTSLRHPDGDWKTVTAHGTLVAIQETLTAAGRLADYLNKQPFGTAEEQFMIGAEYSRNPYLADWLTNNLRLQNWERIKEDGHIGSIDHLWQWLSRIYKDELVRRFGHDQHAELQSAVLEDIDEILHDHYACNSRYPREEE